MNRETCQCGRTYYGLGSMCPICLAARRQERAERPSKLPPLIARVNEKLHPAHLAWIRTLPCSVLGCNGKSEAAHVRMVDTGGGMNLKPADWWTVPLCHHHHINELHRTSHAEFDAKYGLNLHALAEHLAATSPYLAKENA
jgi:hypothetical protein